MTLAEYRAERVRQKMEAVARKRFWSLGNHEEVELVPEVFERILKIHLDRVFAFEISNNPEEDLIVACDALYRIALRNHKVTSLMLNWIEDPNARDLDYDEFCDYMARSVMFIVKLFERGEFDYD